MKKGEINQVRIAQENFKENLKGGKLYQQNHEKFSLALVCF